MPLLVEVAPAHGGGARSHNISAQRQRLLVFYQRTLLHSIASRKAMSSSAVGRGGAHPMTDAELAMILQLEDDCAVSAHRCVHRRGEQQQQRREARIADNDGELARRLQLLELDSNNGSSRRSRHHEAPHQHTKKKVQRILDADLALALELQEKEDHRAEQLRQLHKMYSRRQQQDTVVRPAAPAAMPTAAAAAAPLPQPQLASAHAAAVATHPAVSYQLYLQHQIQLEVGRRANATLLRDHVPGVAAPHAPAHSSHLASPHKQQSQQRLLLQAPAQAPVPAPQQEKKQQLQLQIQRERERRAGTQLLREYEDIK